MSRGAAARMLVGVTARMLRRQGARRLHLVAPRPLGGVLRRIGLGDQVLTPDPEGVAARAADAAGQADWSAESLDPDSRDALADALRHGSGGARIRTRQHHYELLAPIAPDDVRLAQLRLDRRHHRCEAGIACRMTRSEERRV